MTEKIKRRDLSKATFSRGIVQILTGDGKGKTSAAMGAIMRAAGHGLRISVIFFMKGDYSCGERKILREIPGVAIKSFGGEDFIFPDRVKPEQIVQAEQALIAARGDMLSGHYDLIVLDEVNVTAAFKLISVESILQLIKDKPEKVELILTGRKADPRLIQVADLVTEMIKIKHPFDQGLQARAGFDY
jgi:cob(I)alamin adenosyltransferase